MHRRLLHTPYWDSSQAVASIEKHPFKRQLTRPVKEMFDTLGRHSSLVYRMIFCKSVVLPAAAGFYLQKSGES